MANDHTTLLSGAISKDKQQDNVSLGLAMDNVNIHLNDISPYAPALWP